MTAAKHYDYAGRPLCGATAEGALVVEIPRSVTCKRCRAAIEKMRKDVAEGKR